MLPGSSTEGLFPFHEGLPVETQASQPQNRDMGRSSGLPDPFTTITVRTIEKD